MAYHRYVTQGIVLTSRPSGERDVMCSILTEDLGSIFATARSARLPQSKMSQGIQESSFSRFSFIRGAHGWKIVGVQNQALPFRDLKNQAESQKVFARILKFLRKMISGEEKQPELFHIVKNIYYTLSRDTYTNEELFILECVTVLRILYKLGLIRTRVEYESFINLPNMSPDIVNNLMNYKKILMEDINRSLASSA